METLTADARQLADLVRFAGPRGTVAFTGAGISTESGIPDFRSPGTGLWTRNAPISFDEFLSDPAKRRESWRRGLETYAAIAAAAPNAAHRALAQWWEAGWLIGVVTQNIDGLHQRAGVPESAIAELHGNSHRVVCLDCRADYARAEIQARVAAGDEEPACEACLGTLKAATISFGQALPFDVVQRAQEWVRQARLCLVVGTSLVVYPAAALPEETLDRGGRLAIVNATGTHLDGYAALVSRVPAAQLLGAAAEVLASRPVGQACDAQSGV